MTVAIIIIVCCWIISFLFNGIESGLLSIDPVRLRQNVKRRVPAALQLNRLLKHPERLLATVLLVTNAADIIALLLLTSQLFRWYGYAGFCSHWSLRFRFIYLCCRSCLNRYSADFHFAHWCGLQACSNSRRFYFRRCSNSARDWASYSCQVTPGNGAAFLPRARN